MDRTPARVTPRHITDLVLGYEKTRDQRKRYDVGLQFTNLTHRTALYNFQSLFVGTRVVQPSTARATANLPRHHQPPHHHPAA